MPIAIAVPAAFAMSAISFGLAKSLAALSLIRWVLLLPKKAVNIQEHLPCLKNLILYCHVAGAISTLVGVIAVLMTPESNQYQYVPEPKYPLAMGIGIAMLTTLYAAMISELILRPLKHQIERSLIKHQQK